VRVHATGAQADVVVRARDGASLAEVQADLLARVLPPDGTGSLSVAGTRVPSTTLLGAEPLVQGVLLEVGAPSVRRTAAQLELRVVGGPHAGRVQPLYLGELLLGRGRTCDVRLDDPGTSRAHCRLSTGPQGVRVHDLGSANGTSVDGLEVGPAGLTVRTGAVLRVGASRLTVAVRSAAALPVRPTGDGRLAVNRVPRLRPEPVVVQVVVPTRPAEGERGPVPVLAVLAPLVLGIVMWRVTGSTTFLLFTLLSPVLVIGAVVTERRSGARRGRRERALWTAQRAVAEQVLADAVRTDELSRRAAWPDAAELLQTALRPGPRLWERARGAPDVLDVRLGLADLPARVEAEGDVTTAATTACDVPVVVALATAGVMGLAGSGVRGLARWVLLQSAVLHSPRDLQVVVLAEPAAAPGWEWVRWLPHTRPDADQDCLSLVGFDPVQAGARVTELLSRVDARRTERPVPSRAHRPVLLVVDGARTLRDVPGFARLLAEGPALGVHAVCVERDPLLLPVECRATATLTGSLRVREVGRPDVTGTADEVGPAYAEQVARALCPLRDDLRGGDAQDQGEAAPLPRHVRWTEQVGLPLVGGASDATAVLARWTASGRSTRAVLGRGASGAFSVDLVEDGPHALVAGTTGSGKSELLQTLIASLALANRPDELVLVLVDYKGGAAFGPCEHLPHVVGMVTDLDGGLVERALASLGAELTRREAVLRAAGVKDLEDHRRSAVQDGVLPRLVLVVDEFASLAEELPDFVRGLVGIAMRGRSLGVHLVLATQRPEGVVSAEIRANTNLRMCLAVTRDVESRDVIDSPVAATISRSTPGRAWARTGHADLVPFQSARVGGRRPRSPAAEDQAAATVELRPAGELGDPLPRVATGDQSEDDSTDLDLRVTACRAAAHRLRTPLARPPWLPPLDAVLGLEDLPAPADLSAAVPGRVAPIAYALLDVPTEQAQRALLLDLDVSTHLLVLGSARTGRTTVLRTLAGALARSVPVDDVHLYALDCGGGGLSPLARLPHTGAVVGPDEPERLERLLTWLGEQVAARQAVLSAAGHAGLAEQRASCAPADRLPHLLLLLDRWEAFLAAYQDVDAGRLVDLVHRLLREGPAAGLHVVLTADRSGLVGRMASLVEDRLLLRMADPADYAAAGLPGRLAPNLLPPGRGWSLRAAPLVAQVALLDPDPSGPAQVAALERLAVQAQAARDAPRATALAPAVRPPHRIRALPDLVRLADLPGAHDTAGVVLGVGGDGAGPVRLELATGLLVAGPPGSGRSSTLLTLAQGLSSAGHRLVAVAPRVSPLRALPGCVLDEHDMAGLEEQLGDGRVALLVDDAELLVDGPLGPLLEQAVRHARNRGTLVVVAGTTSELTSGYRGFVVTLRRARRGLLLSPESAADGDLLAVRLPRSTGARRLPGRALLVEHGHAQSVQVALP